MTGYLECYRILGVSLGAGISDVSASYKKLCRQHHPDVSDDPRSEELMKNINMAYTVLREKFKREAAFRERMSYPNRARRHPVPKMRTTPPPPTADEKADAAAAVESFSALFNYFKSICDCDYAGAYKFLSDYDKRGISQEDFINWRKSVARIFPMLEFKLAPNSDAAKVVLPGGRAIRGRKFTVKITEEDVVENEEKTGQLEKLVIFEKGSWKVFLGYEDVGEITKSFDKRFEMKKRRSIAKSMEEYFAGNNAEFDMLNLVGLKRAVERELYRHDRYGDELTFACISVKTTSKGANARDRLIRSAARTICSSLRQIDIPAYAGDGVFAVLFSRLSEDDAEEIIGRFPDKIRKNAGSAVGAKAQIQYSHRSWKGKQEADIDAINAILRSFGKEI